MLLDVPERLGVSFAGVAVSCGGEGLSVGGDENLPGCLCVGVRVHVGATLALDLALCGGGGHGECEGLCGVLCDLCSSADATADVRACGCGCTYIDTVIKQPLIQSHIPVVTFSLTRELSPVCGVLCLCRVEERGDKQRSAIPVGFVYQVSEKIVATDPEFFCLKVPRCGALATTALD